MAEPRNIERKPFVIVRPVDQFQRAGELDAPDLTKARKVHAFSVKAPLASNGSTVDLRPQSVPTDVDLTVPKATEVTTPTVDSSATVSASSSETDSSETGSTPEPKEVAPPSSPSESPETPAVVEKDTPEMDMVELPVYPVLEPKVQPGMAFPSLPAVLTLPPKSTTPS